MVSLVGESSLRPDEFWNEKTEGQKGDLFEMEPSWPMCLTVLKCTTWTPETQQEDDAALLIWNLKQDYCVNPKKKRHYTPRLLIDDIQIILKWCFL